MKILPPWQNQVIYLLVLTETTLLSEIQPFYTYYHNVFSIAAFELIITFLGLNDCWEE